MIRWLRNKWEKDYEFIPNKNKKTALSLSLCNVGRRRMANYHRNNVENVVLGRHHHHSHRSKSASVAGHTFRLWNAASFRRIIFDAVSCGASSCYAARSNISDEKQHLQQKQQHHKTTSMKNNAKSEKLSDLLSIAEAETDVETKKKEEKLEDLKRLVKELQQHEEDSTKNKKSEAAAKVRLLAKEELEVRGTLAMLGAIPPLVAMLDETEQNDVNSLVSSLYALLNLGIGNDASVFFFLHFSSSIFFSVSVLFYLFVFWMNYYVLSFSINIVSFFLFFFG